MKRITSQMQLEAIQKRIEEIFRNAKWCNDIDIQIHVTVDDAPEISYKVSEVCVPDAVREDARISEEMTHFLNKENDNKSNN